MRTGGARFVTSPQAKRATDAFQPSCIVIRKVFDFLNSYGVFLV